MLTPAKPVSRFKASSAVTIGLILLLGTILFVPVVAVTRAGFTEHGHFSLEWVKYVLEDVVLFRGLVNSLIIAAGTTALSLLIAFPLAVVAHKVEFTGKRIWLALVQVPLILPPFVGAIGLKSLLSRNGGINAVLTHFGWLDPASPIDWLGSPMLSCIVLEALYLYPIPFLNLQAALANIDPAMDDAARNIGAGRLTRFFRVTLPLARPGIFAGATIVFIWSMTELGTPLMVGFRDLAAVRVFEELQTTNPQGFAYALVVLLLLASTLSYVAGKMLLGRSTSSIAPKVSSKHQTHRCGVAGSSLATLLFLLVTLAASLPHIGVLLVSVSGTGMLEIAPQHLTLKHHLALWQGLVGSGGNTGDIGVISILNSLKYAGFATVADLFIGFTVAYLFVRRRSKLSALLDNIAMIPLAIPGLVLAFGFFAVTQGNSPVAFLDPLEHDPTPLLIIAYTVRRMPYMVRACAAGLEQVSVALEEAALNLGARTLHTVRRILVPLLLPNFVVGSLLVFSRSMLEVSDSLILAFDRETYPMTKAIWSLSAIPSAGLERASALGVWGMVLLLVTIGISSILLGKQLGAVFRL